MRFIQVEEGGVATLNYMWLPTWLGMNAAFKRELERDFSPKVVGCSTEKLDELNDLLIDYIVEKYPSVTGLRDYLDGLKFVQDV